MFELEKAIKVHSWRSATVETRGGSRIRIWACPERNRDEFDLDEHKILTHGGYDDNSD